MADPVTPSKTPTAENQGRREPNPSTEEAQRAEAQQARGNEAQAQANAAAEKRADSEKDAAKAAGASPSGTVSAKENQPVVTPVDTGKPSKVENLAGPAGVAGADKLADLPAPETVRAPVPTQDPPINVDGKVPVGSSRVDLTPRTNGPGAGGAGLQSQPGGHLGAGGPANIPPQPPPNPPARRPGGATRGR